ncbi:MAG: DUF2892 domain-containing protein [Spirochaetales bacterium]|nr:DUF2892 domain-containing protein [Spirochaetales bacterium]
MKNVGKTDKSIRITAGVLLIAAGIILQLTAGRLWWLALPGIVFAGTGLISFCPLYLPFKINTGKK